jgi:hypothetical protein
MWLAAGGNLDRSIAYGYELTYDVTNNIWVITRPSLNQQPFSFTGTVGIYDVPTSQWVLWSNNDQASNPGTYGPINNVQVFRVSPNTGSGSWYINALP